ncbi:hypothetical protein KP509_12G070800 [Ceratopteris richardii]|uniref:1,3-beta-glucan synthase n=1 Tax=Ceratopteris richardii TaxID=49495 RepID=A0A8T2TQM0_CERRI|nr:hypothetical protein KP509_12G070800 [Ceratopteris richardii]KAH7423736.1 hypothetical protein KP509_12G070800 [Ceratopteris richardii]
MAYKEDFEDVYKYNILQLNEGSIGSDDGLQFPAVRAATEALKRVKDLRRPPAEALLVRENTDIFDWLGAFFGFQADNVRNQRENVVLLLANYQMSLQPPPEPMSRLDRSAVQRLRKKLLKNYTMWCSYFHKKPNLWLPKKAHNIDDHRELLYSCLYLLIWGEAANLRFMPECLSFIFHNMAMELNSIIEFQMDAETGQYTPASYGRNGFLIRVVQPIYTTVKGEAEASNGGKSPHSAWRNYDDMNEYFWTKRCFKQLSWPLKQSSSYLVAPNKNRRRNSRPIGKTGFVEQRSFWNIFRSFDHLWISLILMLQAMMILAFNGDGLPWHVLRDRDVIAALLTVFITWAGLRCMQAVLDAGMQYSLISSETKMIGIRIFLKILVAAGWTTAFSVLLSRAWQQRMKDRHWSPEAESLLKEFLEAAALFILPETLAIVLFLVPWVRNFLEKSEFRVLHALTWWFQTRLFVARGLREGVIDSLKYATFWLAILSVKFSFSYFLQVRPLVAPTRELLNLNIVEFQWHEFFRNHNRFVVVVLWAPVVLIYAMDLQIWYSIASSLVGAAIGLFSHIGEIRNMEQLKLRFPFFASAVAFNLSPEVEKYMKQPSPHYRLVALFRDMVRRVKLRYGLEKAYTTFEKSSPESLKFAKLWNEILFHLRQEDLVSDYEVELLQVPQFSWNIDVMQWPSVLLSNSVLVALGFARDWRSVDCQKLWEKISKNEYRKCAVLECYYSFKHLMSRVLKDDSAESSIVEHLFMEIENEIHLKTFCQSYKVNLIPEVHAHIVSVVEAILKRPGLKDIQKVVDTLQNLYDVVVRDFPVQKRQYESLRGAGLVAESNSLLFVDAVKLPDPDDELFFHVLKRLHITLSTKEALDDVPKNIDAKRRISFFSNSLFMNMPHAPSLERMRSFSVLTPYYSEDVIYTKDQLRIPNEDGVTILYYLQSVYPDEWNNFLERMGLKESDHPEEDLWNNKDRLKQLRLWASYRGQTLSRTVRGMMYYQHALDALAYYDADFEPDFQVSSHSRQLESLSYSFRIAGKPFQTGAYSGGAKPQMKADRKVKRSKAIARLKFTYVVACQIYGTQKGKKDAKADDIYFLMQTNPAVRVAYVDEVPTDHGVQYFSVLVKYDTYLDKEIEIYRIQLPGPLKLGEGKPENQNHAIIFTRGDAIQTIDMNQDNYFEEALKMRNLLEEFDKHYGIRRPQILGVREHVFTGSVSSLAWFMSAQETSFVTLGQRVLARPLKVRMHYGHPDVFDRLWFLTRGGISKASRVINISEDIFAGFNCTLRGGNVTHHEYIQVGKGRDVGLNQIALFEAKVSSGNGEQMLSRDVYRLGHHLDFFRMLSFYHTTVGFYIANMLIVLTVYAFLWGRVYLALSGIEDVVKNSIVNTALSASLNQQFIFQMGLFTALPMIIENTLELGFSGAVWDFITMQLELCSVFYAFSLGTKCHYFGRTLLHGGAKYRATGRGFVVRHESFAENYRLYARSHFVKGVELIVLLIIYEAYGGTASSTVVYILLTFSSWFLALSWLIAPFLFNPTGFDWLQTVYDLEDFQSWLWYKGGVLTKAEQSWEIWWNEENDHLRTTDFWGRVLEIVLNIRFFLIHYGMVYRLHIADNNKSVLVYFVSWIYILCAMALYMILAYAGEKYAAKKHLYFRAIQAFVGLLVALVIVLLLELTDFQLVDLLLSFLAFLPTGWGFISICIVLKPFIVNTIAWPVIVSMARLYELAIAGIVIVPLAILSWIPGFQAMQTRILFNQAFSRGLQLSRILTAKKPTRG